MHVVGSIQVAVVFVWLGMVLGISFLETPLKFRAEGMTVQLGVAIGRLVCRALNIAEGFFAIVLVTCAAIGSSARSVTTVVALAVLCAALIAGALVLRPRMDHRLARTATGAATSHRMPRNQLHLLYVALELLKAIALLVLGVAYLGG